METKPPDTPAPFAREASLNVTSLGLTRQVQLQQMLQAYMHESGAESASLLDATGAILVRAGKAEVKSLDTLAVLGAATFSASRALAGQLGDATFGGICHQGRNHWLYLAPAAHDSMFLVLHPQNADLQEIRAALLKFLPRINHVLAVGPSAAPAHTAPVPALTSTLTSTVGVSMSPGQFRPSAPPTAQPVVS